MFTVVISEKQGEKRRLQVDKSELSIGRVQGNDIVLAKGNVSKRHARIIERDGQMIALDLKSTNGTYVNGRKISGSTVIGVADKIYIGDFVLQLEKGSVSLDAAVTAAKNAPAALRKERRAKATDPDPFVAPEAIPPPPAEVLGKPVAATATPAPGLRSLDSLKMGRGVESSASQVVSGAEARRGLLAAHEEVRSRLQGYLDVSEIEAHTLGDDRAWKRAERVIEDIIAAAATEGHVPAFVDRKKLATDVLNEALGLGPLDNLLQDNTVEEIVVNRPDQVSVVRQGRLETTDCFFASEKSLRGVAVRLLNTLGAPADQPIVDARLKDGSRVTVIFPPLAMAGPCLTIRKPTHDIATLSELVAGGALSEDMAELLRLSMVGRRNVLLVSPLRTTRQRWVNALVQCVAGEHRGALLERHAEIGVKAANWMSFVSHSGDEKLRSAEAVVDAIVDLHPDWFVLGEAAAGEALQWLRAVVAGRVAGISVVHGADPRDGVQRFFALLGSTQMAPSAENLRSLITHAFDLVVYVDQFPGGRERVDQICELDGVLKEGFKLRGVFSYEEEKPTGGGTAVGRFVPSGHIPRFIDDLTRRGIAVRPNLFRP